VTITFPLPSVATPEAVSLPVPPNRLAQTGAPALEYLMVNLNLLLIQLQTL
jgi:hypothetical protein